MKLEKVLQQMSHMSSDTILLDDRRSGDSRPITGLAAANKRVTLYSVKGEPPLTVSEFKRLTQTHDRSYSVDFDGGISRDTPIKHVEYWGHSGFCLIS